MRRAAFICSASCAVVLAACHNDPSQRNSPPTAALSGPAATGLASTGPVITSTASAVNTTISTVPFPTGTVTVIPGPGTGAGSTTLGTTPPASTTLIIFRDELQSGGGSFLYPAGDNQTLSFDDTSDPVSRASIRYAWNGQDVAGQHVFAGMDLMNAPTLAEYATSPGRDLRSGNFGLVTFAARGTLSANTVIKIEAADSHRLGVAPPCIVLSPSGQEDDAHGATPAGCLNTARLDTAWQAYRIPVAASDLQAVKDYFKATFIFKAASDTTPAGSGGMVLFDDIEYKP